MNAGAKKVKEISLERQRVYYSDPKLCLRCENPLPYLDHKRKKFCSSSCAASINNLGRERHQKKCLNCQQRLKNSKSFYCSIKCSHEFKYKEFISNWKSNLISGSLKNGEISYRVKRYLLTKHQNKCQKCFWGIEHPVTRKVPLQIHHKDGNFTNNVESNLELLCPNCHSLTENFGKLNNGSGRGNRYK